MEHAPAKVAHRAVDLDLMSRSSFTHSIIRPAWFTQNFSETFLNPVNDEIIVPNGTGAEAYVNAEDVASVAAATLVEPELHAGSAYAPTGPASLRVDAAAQIISAPRPAKPSSTETWTAVNGGGRDGSLRRPA
jgi:uncharacterized protein YbjT (DUF2867 family)